MRTIASIHHKVNPKDSDISTRTASFFSHLIQKLNMGEFVHKIAVSPMKTETTVVILQYLE